MKLRPLFWTTPLSHWGEDDGSAGARQSTKQKRSDGGKGGALANLVLEWRTRSCTAKGVECGGGAQYLYWVL